MQNRTIAIKISGIKKRYLLGQIGGTTLQEAWQSVWARILRKDDYDTQIGQTQCMSRKKFMALNGIDLTVYKGETLGIIGCNGAGKSTLLKILSRITAPTEGEIDIYGRVTSMLEVGTGFNGEMTGRENVYMNGAILGMTKAEIDSKMEEIIEFSEVREFIDTPVKRYSSGMYVKLAFAVAAHLDSEILIMDEVLAVGDMKFQKKCLSKMGNAANYEGKTVLYVSHNMETIRKLCSRCIVLKEGKIIFDGDVESAIDVYMENQGSAQCTYYDYSLEQGRPRWLDMNLRSAKLMNLQLLNKKSATYFAGEPLVFELQIEGKKQIDHIHIRFEVIYADGVPVGAVPDIDLGTIQENVLKQYRIEFDTSAFTRGKYQVRLVVFEKNEFAGTALQDVVEYAFAFQIEDSIEIDWNVGWGHIKLPDLIWKEIIEK